MLFHRTAQLSAVPIAAQKLRNTFSTSCNLSVTNGHIDHSLVAFPQNMCPRVTKSFRHEYNTRQRHWQAIIAPVFGCGLFSRFSCKSTKFHANFTATEAGSSYFCSYGFFLLSSRIWSFYYCLSYHHILLQPPTKSNFVRKQDLAYERYARIVFANASFARCLLLIDLQILS